MRRAADWLLAALMISPLWGAFVAMLLALMFDGYAGPFWGACWLVCGPAYLIGNHMFNKRPKPTE